MAFRSIRSESPFIEIYRWTDGSVVFLVELSRVEGSGLEHGFQICLQGLKPVTIRIQDSLFPGNELINVGRAFSISRYSSTRWDHPARWGKQTQRTLSTPEHERKLLGFIFDLMGRDYLLKRELLWEDTEGGPSYTDLGPRGPTVVSDEEWLNRYSLISGHEIHLHDSLSTREGQKSKKVWYTEFENEFCSPWRDSKEEAIDDALLAYPIVPPSGLEEWFQNNLERGIWVKPTPEEVQVWSILDEKLPFFWPTEDLLRWLNG